MFNNGDFYVLPRRNGTSSSRRRRSNSNEDDQDSMAGELISIVA